MDSQITTPASSCAMRMGRRSAISISKKILGDHQRASRSPKMRRALKAKPKRNRAFGAASHKDNGFRSAPHKHFNSSNCGHCLKLVQFSERNKSNRGGVECRHAAGNAREPGAHLIGGHQSGNPKAAATTSRCVGSEKVASRSGDRPAIVSSLLLLLGLIEAPANFSWRVSSPTTGNSLRMSISRMSRADDQRGAADRGEYRQAAGAGRVSRSSDFIRALGRN
jgi:hypothetical protein